MAKHPGDILLPDPIAYFLTWSTYGTWLPGDSRGWVEYHHGWQFPDDQLELEARARMSEDACRLDHAQRLVTEQTVADHCRIRSWTLHAANCRSNHVHVVVSATAKPKQIRTQLKAWCTTKLKQAAAAKCPGPDVRENWWAERGSIRFIFDEDFLERAILYVRDAQDRKGRE